MHIQDENKLNNMRCQTGLNLQNSVDFIIVKTKQRQKAVITQSTDQKNVYNQICIKRPPLRQRKNGLIRQVTS
jgi:hypothetical protein